MPSFKPTKNLQLDGIVEDIEGAGFSDNSYDD